MSCYRNYGINNYPECSNNGDCIDGKCICHHGWTYFSGFEFIEGYDCDIHILTIRIIFSIILFLSVIFLIVAIYNLYAYPIIFKNILHLKNICIISFTLYIIGVFLISYRRVIDPVFNVVGNDFIVTFGYGIQTNATSLAVYALLNILMNFLFTYFKNIDPLRRDKFIRRLLTTRYCAPFTVFVGISLSILGLLGHLYPKQSDLLNLLSILLFLLGAFASGIVLLYTLTVFISEMQDFLLTINLTIQTNIIINLEIIDRIKKLKLQRNIFGYSVISCVPSAICFTCWNFLRRKHDYMFAIETILGLFMSVITITSFWKNNETAVNLTTAIIHVNSLSQPIQAVARLKNIHSNILSIINFNNNNENENENINEIISDKNNNNNNNNINGYEEIKFGSRYNEFNSKSGWRLPSMNGFFLRKYDTSVVAPYSFNNQYKVDSNQFQLESVSMTQDPINIQNDYINE